MVLQDFAAGTENMNSEILNILLNIQRLILLCTVKIIEILKIWDFLKLKKEKKKTGF